MGVAPANVANWARGANEPSSAQLAEFIRTTRINGHWLLTGDGTPDLYIVAPVGVVSAPAETPTPASTVRSRK